MSGKDQSQVVFVALTLLAAVLGISALAFWALACIIGVIG